MAQDYNYGDRDLRPFRQYNEHDVINLFALELRNSDESLPCNRGTVMALVSGKGWQGSDELDMIDIHAKTATYNNTLSTRWSVKAKMHVHTGSATDQVLGLSLHDVRDTDENGELLVYNPRKAAEMQAAVSGWVVPVAKQGIFLYDGFIGTAYAGASVLIGDDGALGVTPAGGQNIRVGTCLGAADGDGNVLVDFNPQAFV